MLTLVPALVGCALITAVGVLDLQPTHPARQGGELPVANTSPASVASILAGLPDPVIALGRAEEVVAFNTQAGELVPALQRGEPISLALRVPEVLDTIRRARATLGTQQAEFFQHLPVDRWYQVTAVPISLSASEVRPIPGPVPAQSPAEFVLLTFHDRTPLQRMERMRADFIANASHELRTPLAALSGFIDTMQGVARNDAPARERFLAIMKAQADRMARLIDDLLSLSRIELNAHVRPDKQVDLVTTLSQAIDGLQPLAQERGVEIKITVPSAPLMVLGDRDELIRVFENLAENGLKYAASGKRLDIELAPAIGAQGNSEVRLVVRDYGPGIAPEHLPRLTERFYRVDVAESRAQGGTGLGLALVKHILNRHGGSFAIESTQGQGAAFIVHLPLIEAGEISPPES
jgi:two-component system phosphate regulon sensor histidine kinase PhoR